MLRKRLPILLAVLLLCLLLASCAHPAPATQTPSPSLPNAGTRQAGNSSDTGNTITSDNNTSTVHFTLTGALTGTYTITSNPTLSKLRHGHKEFTIDLTNHQQTLFIAFYGYDGPGTYTLTNTLNGGDIRLDMGRGSWDLALQPKASCTLTILNETPTNETGLHKMTGNFSCPLLVAASTNQTTSPLTVNNGSFDIFIIIES